MNDKIYDTTDLSSLVNSLEQYGQLEPIVVNKKNTIISGHRRYYSMVQLGWKSAEIVVREFNSDLIALIQYNEQRQRCQQKGRPGGHHPTNFTIGSPHHNNDIQ